MLFHQRIDYLPPTPGQNVYVRIPLSSTLWTVIEKRSSDSLHRSSVFPSRIIDSDQADSVVFTGVDTSGFLREGLGSEYRVLWRTVADPDDPEPTSLISLPLKKDVTFTFSYGSSTLLSLGIGGVNVMLDFDIPSRVLSTSWFTPSLLASWTFDFPHRLLLAAAEPLLSITDRTKVLTWSQMLCCRKSEDDLE